MAGPSDEQQATGKPVEALSRVVVEGFKSIVERTEIELRPISVLAGANSSGKSSIVQPLLLLKQTLDSPSDPGPLELDGPLALERDRHLLEAALSEGGDPLVLSLDDSARSLLRSAVLERGLDELAGVHWVNPVTDADALSWLAQGAPDDPTRQLGWARDEAAP